MLFAAVPEYKIDLPSSWMIGHSEKEQKAQDAVRRIGVLMAACSTKYGLRSLKL